MPLSKAPDTRGDLLIHSTSSSRSTSAKRRRPLSAKPCPKYSPLLAPAKVPSRGPCQGTGTSSPRITRQAGQDSDLLISSARVGVVTTAACVLCVVLVLAFGLHKKRPLDR